MTVNQLPAEDSERVGSREEFRDADGFTTGSRKAPLEGAAEQPQLPRCGAITQWPRLNWRSWMETSTRR